MNEIFEMLDTIEKILVNKKKYSKANDVNQLITKWSLEESDINISKNLGQINVGCDNSVMNCEQNVNICYDDVKDVLKD